MNFTYGMPTLPNPPPMPLYPQCDGDTASFKPLPEKVVTLTSFIIPDSSEQVRHGTVRPTRVHYGIKQPSDLGFLSDEPGSIYEVFLSIQPGEIYAHATSRHVVRGSCPSTDWRSR